MSETNRHACALEINKTGILIIGQPGSGKTSLMMGLLQRAKIEKLNASLVADDQVYLSTPDQKVFAKVPETIAGMVEIRGYGITDHAFKSETQIELVVELIEDDKIERMPHPKSYEINSLNLPLLEVPQRHENQAVRIIFAWLLENACLQV